MLPKTAKVTIGEKEFTIEEFKCYKRNALFSLIGSFTFAEIFKSVLPLLSDLGVKLESGKDKENLTRLVELGLKDSTIWGGLIGCLVSVLEIGPQIIILGLKDSTNEDEEYIVKNLTITQEPLIIDQIIELNRLPETLKNYKTLITKVKSLVKEVKTSM